MVIREKIRVIIVLVFFMPAICSGFTLFNPNLPLGQNFYDKKPWWILYYYGWTYSDPLWRMVAKESHRWPEHIQSAELGKTLDKDNVVRRFFSPLVGVVQVVGNITYRVGSNQPNIWEFDPYIAFRWANWPWNNYLTTSFALGEGISYASSVPDVEIRNNDDTRRLLNYMLIEFTFSMPSHPDLQLVARIHHRSGVFGLYRAGNTGSNVAGVGIRYLFA